MDNATCSHASHALQPTRLSAPPDACLPSLAAQLYTGMDNATCMGLMPSNLPVFQDPARPLSLADVKEGMRNYFQGSEHDP